MPAAYDTYDYPGYWKKREYEHLSEEIAVKDFLERIDQIGTFLEIGTGYGRLAPSYIFRSKKVILTDPSSKLLAIARTNLKQKNVEFIHSSIENLPSKLRPKSIDVTLLVRVLHHIEKPADAFTIISRLLKDKGYLILEFPNKGHFKAIIKEFLKGNLTFPHDISPKDLTVKRRKKFLPFMNFHPDKITHTLKEAGFEVLQQRSVSNIRSTLLKKILPLSTLILLEKFAQSNLGKLNFGPSIFLLARKK